MNQLEVKAYYPVTMDINIVIYDVIYGIEIYLDECLRADY